NLRPDDPVTMFWTSGTTARPKGAVAPHRVLGNIASYARLLDYTAEDRCLASAPLFYTTANYWVLLVALMSGACCVMQQLLTTEETFALIENERITVMVGMPNMFLSVLNHPRFDSVSTSSLRFVWLGGAPIATRLVDRLTERLGLDFVCQV